MSDTIIVRVRGGVVQSIEKVPSDQMVVVYDYDVPEMETANADDAGEPCSKSEWGPPSPH
jgi:hypothetical protein